MVRMDKDTNFCTFQKYSICWVLLYNDMMIIIWGYDDNHMRIWWWSYEDMMIIIWCYDDDDDDVQLAKETDTNCCTFSKLPDILGSGQPYEVISWWSSSTLSWSSDYDYRRLDCDNGDGDNDDYIGSFGKYDKRCGFFFLTLLNELFSWTSDWFGSGVSGGLDLSFRKSLLQFKDQEDFSHQVSLEIFQPLSSSSWSSWS